jgi:hypothetical protein
MVMGDFNSVISFIIIAFVVGIFSKNMIIVLGIPLIMINLLSIKNGSSTHEGMENNKMNMDNETNNETNNKMNVEKSATPPTVPVPVVGNNEMNTKNNKEIQSSNVKSDEHFEVSRPKKGGSKIDYAATVETAYDELNKVLGNDGIKSLTDDTQKLMKQQLELAKSMEGLAPIVEKMMPMAGKMKEMMESMNNGTGGMSNIMDIAKKMAGGLGGKNTN